MKYIVIGLVMAVAVILAVGILLCLYSCLVIASREERKAEEEHVRAVRRAENFRRHFP